MDPWGTSGDGCHPWETKMTESRSEDKRVYNCGSGSPKGAQLVLEVDVISVKALNFKPHYNMQWVIFMLSRGMKQGGDHLLSYLRMGLLSLQINLHHNKAAICELSG
jgi:hypothetical protein